MKLKLITLLISGLVLFSSCAKEEIDPVLEIFVTTKASENWQSANVYVSNVRFAIEFEDGEQGWGNLQQYLGTSYDTNLSEDNSTLVFNDRHFDIEKLLGLKLMLGNIFLSNGDEGDSRVDIPWYTYVPLDEVASLDNGKSYSIEFILDFDKIIVEEEGKQVFEPNYEIEITEL